MRGWFSAYAKGISNPTTAIAAISIRLFISALLGSRIVEAGYKGPKAK
jgi:hypothetical protein